MGDLAEELRCVLREELLAVTQQLDQLARGQSALTFVVEKINHRLVPSPVNVNSESCISECQSPMKATLNSHSRTFDGDPEATSPSRNDCRMRTSLVKEEGSVKFAKLYEKCAREAQEAEEEAETLKKASCIQRLRLMSAHTKGLILDGVVAGIVILNAIFIGISADNWNGEMNVYFRIDVLFTVIFFMELIARVRLIGISGYFCHSDQKLLNAFDFILVMLDTIQLMIVVLFQDALDAMRDAGIPSASLFRTCRVLRVVRILRVLRHPVFEELLAMFEAVFSGLRTLAWAILLFILVVYVIALLCRDMLGNDPKYEEVYPYFSSVPRSFFTVFRCSFGDCSSSKGIPIFESVHRDFGAISSFSYCSFLFFITIGLFNIISAIFIDRTMTRAARIEAKRTKQELLDEKLWATRVSILISQCFNKMGCGEELDNPECLSAYAEIPVEIVNDVCQNDPKATAALIDLGIDEYDHSNLAKILDYDHSGKVTLYEFLNGLQHMRGVPRRTDVVTNSLLLQGLQEHIEDIQKLLKNTSKTSACFPVFVAGGNGREMSSTITAIKGRITL